MTNPSTLTLLPTPPKPSTCTLFLVSKSFGNPRGASGIPVYKHLASPVPALPLKRKTQSSFLLSFGKMTSFWMAWSLEVQNHTQSQSQGSESPWAKVL